MGIVFIIIAFVIIIAIRYIISRTVHKAGDSISNVFVKKYNEKHEGEISKLRDRYPNYRPESASYSISSSIRNEDRGQEGSFIEEKEPVIGIGTSDEAIRSPSGVRITEESGILDALAEVEKDLGFIFASMQFSKERVKKNQVTTNGSAPVESGKLSKPAEDKELNPNKISSAEKSEKVLQFNTRKLELNSTDKTRSYAEPPLQKNDKDKSIIFCAQCGFRITDNYQFCPECGAVIRKR